jgi:hypothetical protein
MKSTIALVMITIFTAGILYADDTTPPPTPSEEQPQVLTRGPVHEAFAEPVDLNTQPPVFAPIEPPASITENLPAEKPVGDQFVWVPGYWGWDSERNCYIWVSGCWRAAPPSRYWVPGYWSRTDMGWQWVPGFWAQVSNVQQIEYLPAPPAIPVVEPPGAPPTDDNIWVPPCWYWFGGQYVWRPGYWLAAQDGWVWSPSHYVCTPRGYVFVAGHWDYSLRRRGVLFAPVYFPGHYYERPGFSYSLSVAVDIGNLEFGLFTYPRYCHYYFGDYYDNFYIGIGIFPWYECRHHNYWYDPIYEHDRWRHHKVDRDWDNHERHEYDRRRDNKDLRPSRTYREMEQRETKLPEADRNRMRMAGPMDKIVADKKSPMKFEQVRNDTKLKISQGSTDIRKFGDDRSRWESTRVTEKSVQQDTRQRGPSITQPNGGKEQTTAPTEHRQPVTPSPEQKQPTVSPTERRSQGDSHQDNKVTKSERVNIPAPPIVGKKEGVFSGPPSRPSNEQKTESRSSSRSDSSSRHDDSSGDRGSQRGDHGK